LRESDYDPNNDRFDVRFITIGSQAKAMEFCGKQGMAERCHGDDDKGSYRAMGLVDFNLLRLFTDPNLRVRRAENKAAGFSQDWRATKLADGAQLPGAAIVDATGTLRWIHRGTHPGDLPPIAEMLERTRGLLRV